MERRREEDEEEERGGGAGGKMTRRAFRRRAPSTPYNRPPVAGRNEQRKGDGWFSKILLRPAPTILPSLFSSSSAASSKQDYPPPSESIPETRQEDFDKANDPGVFAEKSQPYADPEVHQLLGDKARNVCDSGGIAEVEQWLKQKTFSREQSNRLMELLWSRVRDLSHDDGHAAGFVTKAEGTFNLKAPRESAQCAVLSERWITPKPQEYFQMEVAHDVGSSPVEIAKAYMEALATESFHVPHDGRLVLEKDSFDNGASAAEMSYSSVLRSPVCWPGAFVESNHSYLIPQTRRFKVEPYNFQRTPSSIFSRSKFQGGGGSQKSQNVPLSRWKKSSNSFGGITVPEKYNGSTPSKEFDTSNLASFCSMSSATSNAMKNSSSNLRVTFEKDSPASSLKSHIAEVPEYNIGPSSVHPKSSQMARKILAQLDGTVPSPEEKVMHVKLEKTETKAFLKSASSSMDWHEKRPDVSVINDDKPKDSLGKDIADKENLATEKATTRLVASKYHADILPSVTPKSSNQSILRATEKSSDEGFAFTFPVPVSLNASSEPPPTPTMTSSPEVCRMLSNTEDTIPSFSFGSPKADRGLVFSFGSISSSTLTDTTAVQFKFGSEKQRSLSFRSTSKDNICY